MQLFPINYKLCVLHIFAEYDHFPKHTRHFYIYEYVFPTLTGSQFTLPDWGIWVVCFQVASHSRLKCYLQNIISVTSFAVRVTKHAVKKIMWKGYAQVPVDWACCKHMKTLTGNHCFSCMEFILVAFCGGVCIYYFSVCSWQIRLTEWCICENLFCEFRALAAAGSQCIMLNAVLSSPPCSISISPWVPTP